jgi:hypothetical protein
LTLPAWQKQSPLQIKHRFTGATDATGLVVLGPEAIISYFWPTHIHF